MMVKASTTSTKDPRNAAATVEVIVVRVVMVFVRYTAEINALLMPAALCNSCEKGKRRARLKIVHEGIEG
jgi:hypothetical protein